MYPRLRTALLAGCAGGNLSIDDALTTTPTDTTIVGSTTQTTQPTADALLPSVTKDGISNASALLSAHKPGLEKTGYSFEYRTETTVEEKSVTAVQNGVVSARFATFESETTSGYDVGEASRDTRNAVWANKSSVLSKSVSNGTIRYRELLKRSARIGLNRSYFEAKMSKSMTLGLLLSNNEFEVTETERADGQTLTTLGATELDASTSQRSTAEATVVVDSTG